MRRARLDYGYSLLEALVAFVVLALALRALLDPLSTLTQRASAANDAWVASELAHARLAAVGITAPIEDTVRDGTWGDEFSWEIRISPHDNTTSQVTGRTQLFHVHITVSRQTDGVELAHVSTLRRAR